MSCRDWRLTRNCHVRPGLGHHRLAAGRGNAGRQHVAAARQLQVQHGRLGGFEVVVGAGLGLGGFVVASAFSGVEQGKFQHGKIFCKAASKCSE